MSGLPRRTAILAFPVFALAYFFNVDSARHGHPVAQLALALLLVTCWVPP